MTIVKHQDHEPPGGDYTFVGVLRDLERQLPPLKNCQRDPSERGQYVVERFRFN